jgi:hypothetical protein
MRDPRFTIRVQQRFGCCSSTQVDDPDVDVRENFSGSRPRLAGAGHNPGQLFAEIRTFVGRAEPRGVAERTPCLSPVVWTGLDGAPPDILAQDAANDSVPGLVQGNAPIIDWRADRLGVVNTHAAVSGAR